MHEEPKRATVAPQFESQFEKRQLAVTASGSSKTRATNLGPITTSCLLSLAADCLQLSVRARILRARIARCQLAGQSL